MSLLYSYTPGQTQQQSLCTSQWTWLFLTFWVVSPSTAKHKCTRTQTVKGINSFQTVLYELGVCHGSQLYIYKCAAHSNSFMYKSKRNCSTLEWDVSPFSPVRQCATSSRLTCSRFIVYQLAHPQTPSWGATLWWNRAPSREADEERMRERWVHGEINNQQSTGENEISLMR